MEVQRCVQPHLKALICLCGARPSKVWQHFRDSKVFHLCTEMAIHVHKYLEILYLKCKAPLYKKTNKTKEHFGP